MRAAVFQGIGLPHKVETVPDPAPAAGEVVVRVRRSGICATDLVITGPPVQHSPVSRNFATVCKPGTVFGHEFAGEVVALGRGVSTVSVGDRLAPLGTFGCGQCLSCLDGLPHRCRTAYARMGGYAEYAIVAEPFVTRLPDSVSFDQGALIEPLSCSFHAVGESGLGPHSRIAVIGAGPIALGIVHFARHAGARRVVAVARTERQRELAARLGADAFLTQADDVQQQVTEALGGQPDVVFETCGATGAIDQAVAWVRAGGVIVAVAVSPMPDTVLHTLALLKEVTLRYALAYSVGDFDVVTALLARGGSPVGDMITRRIALDDFPLTFEGLRTRKTDCKVLVAP